MNTISKNVVENKFNEEEYPIYMKTYLFIKGFAHGCELQQTLKALPLARVLHDGQHRNAGAPYIIHPLKVCSTLISLGIKDDEILAASLLHDVVEDCESRLGNPESLMSTYGFSQKVFDTVMLLTKESKCSKEQLDEYFDNIKTSPAALLIKLADRSHNSETLYVMKLERLNRYITETREYIYDLCKYGKMHYPCYSNAITVLKSKIVSLCNATEIIVQRYEAILNEQKTLETK